MMKLLISYLFLLLVAMPVAAEPVKEDPLEREMLGIAMKLRCAVCQNQPVAESNSGLAQDMRAAIRDQLQQGKNEDEIIDYFVARYGDYVLLKPRTTGIGMPLWVLPPVVLVVAMIFAFSVLRKRHGDAAPAANKILTDADRERIRKARQADGRAGEDTDNDGDAA